MIAILAEVFIPAGVVGLAILIIDGNRKIDLASALIYRPPATAAPLPTFEPGERDRPFTAGDETDVVEALRLVDTVAGGDELADRRRRQAGVR